MTTATRSTATSSVSKATKPLKATKTTKATKKTTKKATKKAAKKATAAAAAALTAAIKNRNQTDRSIAETPPRQPSIAESESSGSESTVASSHTKRLEKEVTYLKHCLAQPHVHKSHSRKHKSRSRRHRYEYSSSSTDSEEGAAKRVSFLHQEGKKPFLSLHERYRAVDIKYFKQIFFGTFRSEHLIRLAHTSYTKQNKRSSKDKDDDVQEVTGLNQLLRCFEVYSQAICHFAHPSIQIKLHETLSDYRVRLSDMSIHYTFASIREYNRAFMSVRKHNGQDVPIAWATEDQGCANLLIQKSSHENESFCSEETRVEICRDFNADRCTYENCKYTHICLACQQDHAVNQCPHTLSDA